MKDKIVILGAGESGVGAAILAVHQGFTVFVSDGSLIANGRKEELSSRGISFEEGGNTENLILDASIVIKSPGVPETAPIVQEIKAHGIPVISEIEFAYRYKGDSKVVAITGTN